MFGKNKKEETFLDYLFSLSDESRLKAMKFLEKYGEPNEVLHELSSIVPCCQTKKREVRINQNYLLWYNKATLLDKSHLYLFEMDSIEYCYYSYCQNGDYGKVGWLNTAGKNICFSGLEKDETIAIFRELQKYVHGFDRFFSMEAKDEQLLPSFDNLHFYFFKDNTLYARRYTEITKKIKDSVCIPNIQDIIWCDQWYAWDSDTSDTYALDIYLVNEKRPVCLFSDSEDHAFALAVELKKRVPHLMYEPNQEYAQIFKRNPAELMALAKAKCKNN